MFNWLSSPAKYFDKRSCLERTSSVGRAIKTSLSKSNSFLRHSSISLEKSTKWSRFYVEDESSNVMSGDQKVITDPKYNSRRRTVVVIRGNDQHFGFTIQSYLLKKWNDTVPVKVSYVDNVQFHSPAARAGIRTGDVIISINGQMVLEIPHQRVIELISSCTQMRMIVIFESIRERVLLTARAIRLRKLLNDKLFQLNVIDIEEQEILNRAYARSLKSRSESPTISVNSTESPKSACSRRDISEDFIKEQGIEHGNDSLNGHTVSNIWRGAKNCSVDESSTELEAMDDDECTNFVTSVSVDLQSVYDTPRDVLFHLSVSNKSVNTVGYNHVIRLE